jgi:hypothetical protein
MATNAPQLRAQVSSRLNGYRLNFADIEAYEWLIARYEKNEITKDRVQAWFRNHLEKL